MSFLRFAPTHGIDPPFYRPPPATPRALSGGATNGQAGAAIPQRRRDCTLGEEITNNLTHRLSLGIAIAALVILVGFAAPTGDRHSLGSAITHSIALMLQYPAPTLHHALTHPRAKHVFKASTIAAPIS